MEFRLSYIKRYKIRVSVVGFIALIVLSIFGVYRLVNTFDTDSDKGIFIYEIILLSVILADFIVSIVTNLKNKVTVNQKAITIYSPDYNYPKKIKFEKISSIIAKPNETAKVKCFEQDSVVITIKYEVLTGYSEKRFALSEEDYKELTSDNRISEKFAQ